MSDERAAIVLKSWDFLTEHPRLVMPLCLIAFLSCSLTIYVTHPGIVWSVPLYLVASVTGGFLLVLPSYGLLENERITNRLANVSVEEKRILDCLVTERPSTLNVWPHDHSVAGLLDAKILKTLPNAIGNGMVTIGLTDRAKRILQKDYPVAP